LAVKLRLRRMGKKKQPVYKVVAADARSPRDGKFIEAIGLYNPKTDPATVDIKEARAIYWLGVGAQPTDTVKNLLSHQGIILKRELMKQGLSEEQIAVKMDEWKKLNEANLAAASKKKADKAKAKKASADKQDKTENEAEA
jgi:small subunit ribosomal protein S16